MKKKIAFIMPVLCFLMLVLGMLSAEAVEQQKLNIELNRSVTIHPGSSENKRFQIYVPQAGSLEVLFTIVPTEKYYYRFYSINQDGSLEEMISAYCYTDKESVTGTITFNYGKLRLPQGTYIIEIRDANGLGWYNDGYSYTITTCYTPEPDQRYEKEFNDKARNAMPVAANTMITGNLGTDTDHDYYRVSLPASGTLQAEFVFDVKSDYYLDLMSVNRDGTLEKMESDYVYASKETVYDTMTFRTDEYSVPAGDYYLHIYPARGLLMFTAEKYTNKDYYVTFVYRR